MISVTISGDYLKSPNSYCIMTLENNISTRELYISNNKNHTSFDKLYFPINWDNLESNDKKWLELFEKNIAEEMKFFNNSKITHNINYKN